MDFHHSSNNILDTIAMIEKYRLDIRTVTMGISLLGCMRSATKDTCTAVYDTITRRAENLVSECEKIERELGIPIVNKRISVTPVALITSREHELVAHALDEAAKAVGVNFIGGYSALVEKGMSESDSRLIASIPEALASTDVVCSSVNIGSSRAGINMDAVRTMGEVIKRVAELTKDQGAIGCAKLVVFANAVGDNPFMAGAFHGVEEPDCVVSVGVSGPGVVDRALGSLAGPAWMRWRRRSRRRHLRLRGPASWWAPWRPSGFRCRLGLWICPWRRPPNWGIRWRTSWSTWGCRRWGRMGRPRRWRCLMMR